MNQHQRRQFKLSLSSNNFQHSSAKKQFNDIFVGTAINQQGPLLNMQTVLQVTRRLWLWRQNFHFNFINNSIKVTIKRLIGRILSVAATSTCSEVTGHGVGCNPRARLRHVPYRLLQCMLLAGAPKATTDKLQRLLNAAARLLSGTKKFDRGLSQLMTFIGSMFRSE